MRLEDLTDEQIDALSEEELDALIAQDSASEIPSLESQLAGLSPEQAAEFTAISQRRDDLAGQLEEAQIAQAESDEGFRGQLIAGAGNFADAALLGFGDEVGAISRGNLSPESIAAEADRIQTERLRLAEVNPTAGSIGTGVGVVAPLVASGGGQLLGRGAATALQGLGRVAGVSAAQSGIADTRQAGETDFLNLQERAANAAIGGSLGAALPGLGSVVRKGASGVSKKFTEQFLGFTKSARNKLPGRTAKSKEARLDKILDVVNDKPELFRGTDIGGREAFVRNADEFIDATGSRIENALEQAGESTSVDFRNLAKSLLSEDSIKSIKRVGESSKKVREETQEFLTNIVRDDTRGGFASLTEANQIRKNIAGQIDFRGPEKTALGNRIAQQFESQLRKEVDDFAEDAATRVGSQSFRALKNDFAQVIEARRAAADTLASDKGKQFFSLRNLAALGIVGSGAGTDNPLLTTAGVVAGVGNTSRGQAAIRRGANTLSRIPNLSGGALTPTIGLGIGNTLSDSNR